MSEQLAAAMPVGALPEEPGHRLAALFDAHEDRLYRLARRLTRNADDASDLVQETFLRAAKSLRAVPVGFAKEESWLIRVLVNIQRDRWRRSAVRHRTAAILRADVASCASDPESALMAKQAIWGALDALAPRRRAIIVLHELEGMDLSSIASTLGLSGLAVRWHLSMARRDLRAILTPHLGDLT